MSEIKAKIGGHIRVVSSLEELRQMVILGQLQVHHPVYLPEMNRWAHASEIPELVEALEHVRLHGPARSPSLFSRFGNWLGGLFSARE